MTPEKREKTRARGASPGTAPTQVKRSKKRARARRARMIRRITLATLVVVLVLGLAGLGVWLLFGGRPQVTVQHYPVEYEAQIRACAADSGIDPAWAAAVILAESSYQPEAVSEANAQGLMQLLPTTAQWIAEKFDEPYDEGCLFVPETNIRYGCWYLGFLSRRFGGDMTCATAAYHAGQGRVDEWLADPENSPDGRQLTRIPSQATATYVDRVLRYYEKYEQLYAQET
ncbi:MAG: lytic transglycosylase domain-containing protein [Clostridia bacterium]|nr:lytic transglycosylase domain-containing protein [Clostridia bacterium]